jgi:hypothetical protein
MFLSSRFGRHILRGGNASSSTARDGPTIFDELTQPTQAQRSIGPVRVDDWGARHRRSTDTSLEPEQQLHTLGAHRSAISNDTAAMAGPIATSNRPSGVVHHLPGGPCGNVETTVIATSLATPTSGDNEQVWACSFPSRS